MLLFLMCALLCSKAIWSEEAATSSFRFSGIPAVGYDPDSGLGGGLVGNFYLDEKGYDPYKMSIGLKTYLSTKFMNSHALKIERIRAFGLPWRLTGRVGFFSTIAQNYCGKASDADCDLRRAESEAHARGLSGKAKEDFERNYYQNRLMSFYGDISSRWLLSQNEAKLEFMTGYHGAYYVHRDFKNRGTYKNSLYEQDFKNSRLDGYLSMVDVGLMLDKRDIEAAPNSGYWLEGSLRGASSIIGSAWDFLGLNLSARFYWPLDNKRKLIIASQSIADAMIGDVPYDAMSRIGGSLYLNDVNAIGGQSIGRGIREQFFVGRIKAISQLECRYNFWSFDLWNQHFVLTGAPFLDLAIAAWDFSRFTRDMKKPVLAFGTGLRVLWNNTFVIRADLGMSPAENFGPRFLLVVGNVF